MKFSNEAGRVLPNPILHQKDRISEQTWNGKKLIRFEIGESHHITPRHIIDAAIQSLRNGESRISSAYGIEELRDAICQDTCHALRFTPKRSQVIVGQTKLLIYFLLRIIANPEDEIIISTPGFASYQSLCSFLNITPSYVTLVAEFNFRLDPAKVLTCITKRTKGIVINSPHNPTGAVVSKEDIDELYRMAKEHDFWIISDEVYRMLRYDGESYSPGILDSCQERSIIVNSFSKSHALSGMRLGYVIGPQKIIEKLYFLVQNTTSGIPVHIQQAGVQALIGPQDEISAMKQEYKNNRDILVKGLNELQHVSCHIPAGGLYVFPNITDTGMTSKEFSDKMYCEAGVVVSPGTYFGDAGEGFVRMSFSIPEGDIREGLERMKSVLNNNHYVNR